METKIKIINVSENEIEHTFTDRAVQIEIGTKQFYFEVTSVGLRVLKYDIPITLPEGSSSDIVVHPESSNTIQIS